MELKFLRHPTPYEHECLESYLHRLASENFVPEKWILDYFSLKPVLYETLSDFYDIPFDKISDATSLSDRTLKNMTAHGALDIYSDQWFDLIHNGISKFCPLCLNEQNYPRVYWQFNLLNICLVHNTVLISKCPDCSTHITVKEIINGKCSCGKELGAIEPLFLSQNDLLAFTRNLYAAHGILTDTIEFYHGLTGPQYTNFISTLLSLLSKYRNILSQDWIPQQNEFGECTELSLQYLLYRIMEDWPKRLFDIFDDIYFYSDINVWHKENIFNPIINISSNCPIQIHRSEYNFVNRLFFEYLHSRYNYNHFIKKFEGKLIEERYLSGYDLYDMFGIFHFGLFEIHNIEKDVFVDIMDVFELFNSIFEKIEPAYLVKDNDYISFDDLVKLRPKGLFDNIFEYIRKLEQPIYITDYEERGIRMFSFPKP